MVRHRFRGMAFESREWKLQFPIHRGGWKDVPWLSRSSTIRLSDSALVLWSGRSCVHRVGVRVHGSIFLVRAAGRFIFVIVL